MDNKTYVEEMIDNEDRENNDTEIDIEDDFEFCLCETCQGGWLDFPDQKDINMSNELGEPNTTLKATEKSIEQIWREEALSLAVDANIGYTGLETFVKGYIAGRQYKVPLIKMTPFPVLIDEALSINELWVKNSDGTISKLINVSEEHK